MSWWTRPAPVEPSAAERIGPQECAACRSVGPAMQHTTIAGWPDPLWLCVDTVACRQRAEAAGIYLTGGSR